MRIENDIKLDYKNVLIRPKRSTLESRSRVDLDRKFKFVNYRPSYLASTSPHDYEGIPIIAANMDGVGTFKMADVLAEQGIMTCLVKTYDVMELVDFFDMDEHDTNWRTEHVAMSIGITEKDINKFRSVYEMTDGKLKYVCIDVANGYTERFVDFVKEFRNNYPRIVIIAGNVVTADQTQELILNGADIVKVGIGPGSVCTTRIKTGVGYPQLSAVIECADAAHGLGGHIIADGGCTTSGDVVKAFAGGADFVMLGGMLAGHMQGGGEVITKYYQTNELIYEEVVAQCQKIEEKKFVQFYGMSSDAANKKHFGGLKNYRSSEGREVLIPYRGNVGPTIQDILGGIRSACTYVGASELKQLSKCTTFVMCHDTHNRVYE
tara:strand:+ start:525 stop:1658 length:1134 start_codon:yes stop_codon:yes gene_type:complete